MKAVASSMQVCAGKKIGFSFIDFIWCEAESHRFYLARSRVANCCNEPKGKKFLKTFFSEKKGFHVRCLKNEFRENENVWELDGHPRGGCESRFGLVITTLSVRVLDNIRFGVFKIKSVRTNE